jgi:outer membrane lipoprotein-sorting protein
MVWDDMKKCLWLVLIGAACLTLGWADSFEGIRAAADSVQSLQADFVQEKHLPILARPLVSKGHFAFRRPGDLRWEYTHPLHSVLLMHNGGARRFGQSDNQWVETPAGNMQSMDIVFQEITNWLNGRFDESALFTASLMPGHTIVLTPKSKGLDQFIQRMELVMSDQPGVMQEVVIFESPKAFTRIRFVNPRINPPLADPLFEQVP